MQKDMFNMAARLAWRSRAVKLAMALSALVVLLWTAGAALGIVAFLSQK